MPEGPGARGWTTPVLEGALAGGARRAIVLHPDPRLRTRCEPAGYLRSPDQHALAADMLATMYHAGGRGLAAPQVGVLSRMLVMDAGWKEGRPAPLVLVDPEVLVRSDEMVVETECCLSIPGRPVAVARPRAIAIAWYDLDGRSLTRHLQDGAARIALHEVDHLDGRLIVED